eukprot:TRINITY_DN44187_c0_g1_i1.p1 TRINITY_DN44187_c0_g1~~TRINITY_DN44187_c0_g1_i1.p1  ORF type:complete len:723 (+),score=116.25 TRINITY_DN44187_c0_g1_i1:84-2252(+)
MQSQWDKRPPAATAQGVQQPDVAATKTQAPAACPETTINPLTGNPYSRRFHELLERRRKLPCWDARKELLRLLRKCQVLFLVGESGAGKTTQLPQILLDAGYHVQDGQLRAIACAEPQAATASIAAMRVSEELEVPLGSYVGYTTEFDDKTSQETLLKFTTHKQLLREMLLDPLMERYSVVLIDEMHLRTQESDMFCGLLKEIQRRRSELRVVIMSASTDPQRLRAHFDDAPLIHVPGRSHPVEIFYMSGNDKDYLKAAVKTVLHIHANEVDGDILVFLTGDEEVESACLEIRKEAMRSLEPSAPDLAVLPLHSTMALTNQLKAFELAPLAKSPGGRSGRKVIVATDMAETSVSIDGIVYVVDAGFSRQRHYNPRTRLDCRLVCPISKASASSRASCAGRSSPGKCFRLYHEKSFKEFADSTHPEILRSDICSAVLLLKALGIDDLVQFEYVDPPSIESLMRALETLNYLGFLDDSAALTHDGERAVKFPLEPQLAKMLIESPKHRCSNEALSIAAMLTTQTVFLRPKGNVKAADEARNRFAHLDGDHLTLLNVFHAYKQHLQDGADASRFCADNYVNQRAMKYAENVREHLKRLMEQLGLQMLSTDFQDKEYYPNIRRCLISGFFTQVAHLSREKPNNTYVTVRDGNEVAMHPCTCLQQKPDWIIFNEYIVTSRHFVRILTQVRPEWLADLAPNYYDLKTLPQKSEGRLLLEKVLSRRTAS